MQVELVDWAEMGLDVPSGFPTHLQMFASVFAERRLYALEGQRVEEVTERVKGLGLPLVSDEPHNNGRTLTFKDGMQCLVIRTYMGRDPNV